MNTISTELSESLKAYSELVDVCNRRMKLAANCPEIFITNCEWMPDGIIMSERGSTKMNSNTFYAFAIKTWGLTDGVEYSIRFAEGIITDLITKQCSPTASTSPQ